MLSKNIRFKNFTKKKFNKNLKVLFKKLTNKSSYNDNVVKSFSKSYSYSFTTKQLKKFKKFNFFQIYGMGGSSLGIQAIYDFMKPHSNKKAKFKGKKAPLFFACLYLLLCFVSIFSIDPVLWFLKYAALFGVLTAVLLIAYIIRTDEL